MMHSVDSLASMLKRASEAHHEYEATLGHADDDWPSWYAAWMLREERAEREAIVRQTYVIQLADT